MRYHHLASIIIVKQSHNGSRQGRRSHPVGEVADSARGAGVVPAEKLHTDVGWPITLPTVLAAESGCRGAGHGLIRFNTSSVGAKGNQSPGILKNIMYPCKTYMETTTLPSATGGRGLGPVASAVEPLSRRAEDAPPVSILL